MPAVCVLGHYELDDPRNVMVFDTHEHEAYFRHHDRPTASATVLEVGVRRYFRDGEDVRLVPAADAQALANAVDELRSDAKGCAELGRAARVVFERGFSAEALRPELLGILRANGA